MFGLVEEPKRGVPGAVRTDRDQVLQVLKTRSEVSTAVLLQLVVGRPEAGMGNSLILNHFISDL